ncbi:MAG: hypothetical protein N5P05_001514 [Chroococcopsis gigantea SAG 12.99]|jgi:hypothetical protein|nr:Tab2/Atab2 family RNA-binding protein [Chlorogloea purpurea SAG 13.99]MDV2999908.1 hypothetical protein [Chroococcopsis gigantea SAG 12.99]
MAIWELDFYSRPVLDENQKKLWEVLICEAPSKVDQNPETLYKFTKVCPNTTVNSLWLQGAIAEAIQEAGVTPKKIRFFRRQMNNMISKACEDLGISPVSSRRTYTLCQWLDDRKVNFYPQQEGYDIVAANSPSVQYPPLNPTPLPEAVRGDKSDKWSFVSLQADAFREMNEWDIAFKELFPILNMGVSADTIIPGLIIYSGRALPLAGWMSGLDLGYLKLEMGTRPIVRLETAASDSWILVNITSPGTLQEAKNFEEQKSGANKIHFLAIQSSPDSESFAGFWLLKENEPG